PLLLYNMPESTGIHFPSEAAEELSAHPNIVGLKDSSGDLRSLHLFLGCTPPDFSVLTGSTLILGASAGAGAVGAILAMGNVAPELCVELFEAGRTGDMDRVLGLQPQLGFLTRAIQGAYGIPGIKAAVDLLGGRGGAVRSPLQPLTDEDRAEVAAALEEGGVTRRHPREVS
ncbi:MAG: dihydrodipicolinate synthase family protein, partial [Candidatus Latescibacteria bacterium]|nr:dihydrodipicolinate synthase family protein [Candidatus Latescibacterota bacterium]